MFFVILQLICIRQNQGSSHFPWPLGIRLLCRCVRKDIFIMTTQTATIREIVTADYRAAKVLEDYGIDFCYSGNKTLEEISLEQHLNNVVLEKALANLTKQPSGGVLQWNFKEWKTRFLIEYITHTHHYYIRKVSPELLRLGERVSAAESERFPETTDIHRRVIELINRSQQHLTSEEYALFPYILEMEAVRDSKRTFAAPEFGRVEKPVRAIENEHMVCIGQLRSIRTLTSDFSAPHRASQEHRSWYSLLREFNADLHLHIHLENHILFPRAIGLETELLQRKGVALAGFN